MTIIPSPADRWPNLRLALLALPLLGLLSACENNAPAPNRSAARVAGTTPSPLPTFQVAIDHVRISWADGQQTFALTLTNAGPSLESIHAIVYGRNEEITPPRRAISPPTASDWFTLADSRDGKLTPEDIEKHWKDNAFVSARGGKLKFSWDTTVPAGASKTIEAGHDLDELSPYPATRGKRLARAGFTEYQVWLFTADGRCFHKETVPVTKVEQAVEHPVTRPATGKQPLVAGPQAEADAAEILRLARYYIRHDKTDQAREKLTLIVEKYPQTEAARTARQLLRELRSN
jgi:hypothetical protein